jgi:hypothetical protein
MYIANVNRCDKQYGQHPLSFCVKLRNQKTIQMETKEQFAAFTTFLSANNIPLVPSTTISSKRRTNLATLDSMSIFDFSQTCTDVFDEMTRRQSGAEEFLGSQDSLTVGFNWFLMCI